MGALALLLLAAVGQPLATDDAWWHLALGRAYAEQGPWLAADPLLFTAPGPPLPAAWLSDVVLFGALHSLDFAGLRVAHVAMVAAILALAWSLLRRASGCGLTASLLTGAFAVLATYRLVQLRPHLVTILATLVLYRLLIEPAAPPSRRRIAGAAALLALWANAHAGFVLGPILVAAALGGLALAAPLRRPEARRRDRARAVWLALALVLGGAATLASPNGFDPHLAWLAAGSTTPALGRVADEWLAVDPFRLPVSHLPPSPLSWGLVWGLLAGTPVAAFLAARGWRRGADDAAAGTDPALVALAAVSLVALLSAVRFLWLGIFPLLLVARSVRSARSGVARWAVTGATVLLVPAFVLLGPWPMLSRAIPRSWAGYAQPYSAARYYGHAVWLLEDAGLEGNLFNDYFMGGFLGFWLAPEVRAFANGTLNLEAEAMEANRPIRERRGVRPGEDFPELLDRLRVDLFLGIRLPEVGHPTRPWFSTTGHLERTAGWIPVFRNLRSALYLRDDPRNQANLERVAAYYAREGVPFDPERGFDAERVVREAPDWAVDHGLVPFDIQQLVSASHDVDPMRRRWAQDRLASLYAALGLYERAIRLDRRLLKGAPDALAARRRLVWSLLRLGRSSEALAESEALSEAPAFDGLSHAIADAAQDVASGREADAAGRVARLPVFTRAEAARLLDGFVPPPVRGQPR